MSKLVTFEQAKKLKELGYDKDVVRYYKDDGFVWQHTFFDNECRVSVEDLEYNSNSDSGKYSAPSISEALEWFREVKGIECNVSLDVFEDEYRPLIYQYTGMYWEGYSVFDTDGFDTHFDAELALLDALIEYVSK